MQKITKDTTLSEILRNEGSQEILAKHNVPCLGCAFMNLEMDKLTLGDICKAYGIDLEKLLKDLNKPAAKKESILKKKK